MKLAFLEPHAGHPGVLIEISKDFEVIKKNTCLIKRNGFVDDDIKSKKIDYSGICSYSALNQMFLIVSDKAKRLFLYDWEKDTVIQSFSLGYEKGGDTEKLLKLKA